MKTILLTVGFMAGLSDIASAQAIERACLSSDREAKSRLLCGCLQQAANLTLATPDQKLAASFYKDPQKAQDIRQSNNRSHERFWNRYKDYAEVATTFCEQR